MTVGMIQGKVPKQDCTTPRSVANGLADARTVLLVDASEALQRLHPRPDRQSVILTQMRMLCRAMLDKVQPDAIVAPLIASDWDVVDLGVLLQDMGYEGALYAMTRPLPRAELVLREVGAVCPRLTVRLLEIG